MPERWRHRAPARCRRCLCRAWLMSTSDLRRAETKREPRVTGVRPHMSAAWADVAAARTPGPRFACAQRRLVVLRFRPITRTASPTRSAVNTADSAPCFSPNPIRSASVKATTAPTTAWVVVLAGPMMLARRLIATWSHAGEIIADGFRTERSSPFLIGPLDAEANHRVFGYLRLIKLGGCTRTIHPAPQCAVGKPLANDGSMAISDWLLTANGDWVPFTASSSRRAARS